MRALAGMVSRLAKPWKRRPRALGVWKLVLSVLSSWKRPCSGIQVQAIVFRGCFHFRTAMSQHDLRILRGEFPVEDALAVWWKQADDVRKLVQERTDLGAKRASYIKINAQQLVRVEPSRSSIIRDNEHTRSELKESPFAVDCDGRAGTRILDGTGHIRLLIEPSPGSVLYFQGVLGTAFVQRVVQRSELPRSVGFGFLEPCRASVVALQNFEHLTARPHDDPSAFANRFQFFQDRIIVCLFLDVCMPR